MTSVPLQRTRRSAFQRLATFAVLACAACAGAIAKAPPGGEPSYSRVVIVPGSPIVIAAKSARILQGEGYATKRFRSDSTWASRAADNMSARLRYTMPSRDSTRVLVEYWGKCEGARRNCFVGELVRLVSGLTTDEGPPQ